MQISQFFPPKYDLALIIFQLGIRLTNLFFRSQTFVLSLVFVLYRGCLKECYSLEILS